MRINVILELRLPDRARVTIHKAVYASREEVLEIVRTGLSGDQYYAHIAGSMTEHLEALQSLYDNPPESDMVIDVRFNARAIGVKYRLTRRTVWRFGILDVAEFVDIDPGNLMRTVQLASTIWTPNEASLALNGGSSTISGRTS